MGTSRNALFEGWGLGTAARNSWDAAQDGWQWEDNINLLGFIPFAVAGASRFIAASRAVRNPGTTSANAVLKDTRTTNLVAGSKPGCFVAGTEILTIDGIKNIEDIKVGDWVIADDPTTPGEIEQRQVLDAYEREATTLIDIYVDGEVISATEEHPFWVVDKGWVDPKDLEVGDKLQTEDGQIVDIDKLEKREGDFKVYNFHVEGIPTYFVSDLGILVHNNTNCPGLTPDQARRKVMQEQGVPTSQQPISQSRNASGREYRYEVPKPGGGQQTISVQQQTLDSSHPGQGHWEAGIVKTDPLTGDIRMTKHGRPRISNSKSKADYD